MSEQALVCEYYGANRKSLYRVQPGGGSNRLSPIDRDRGVCTSKQSSISAFFRDVFLPQGYPESVTDDYFEYQCWDTMQAFCSSLTGTLATEAVMKSVGVGDQSATALAATLTWLMKDGAGMVGRIAFAWAKGSYLDCDSKTWRLVADVLNDLSIFVNILSPYFKPFFTYIICFSSVCSSIVGVAGGATRAAMTQHQARRNNLADVSAKDGSQETLVNLSALIVSMLLVPLVSGKSTLVWALFCVLTCLHLFANYRAVRSLRMDTVNESRYRILIRHFFNSGPMSVREVNGLEPILFDFGSVANCRLEVGCRLSDIGVFDHQTDEKQHRRYQIGIDVNGGGRIFPIGRKILGMRIWGAPYVIRVALRGDATATDVLFSVFHAELIRSELTTNPSFVHGINENDVIASTRAAADRVFGEFMQKLNENGWITSYTLLHCDEWRYCLVDDDGDTSYKRV